MGEKDTWHAVLNNLSQFCEKIKPSNTHMKHNNVAIVWTSPVAEKFFRLATRM